jgi:hypothetical protein
LFTQHTPPLASSAAVHVYVVHAAVVLLVASWAPLQVVVAAEHFWFGLATQHTPPLASSAAEHWYVVHAAVVLVVCIWAPLQVAVAAEHF